jgi:hypothetical protein
MVSFLVSLRNGRCFAACVVLILFVPAALCAAPLSYSSRVGPAGVGPIIFGTTPAQVASTGTLFSATSPAPGSTCFYFRPSMLSGLSFMFENGTLRRAEISTPAIRTTDGFAVGDPASKIMAFYGQRASQSPDKYDPKAQTIAVLPKDTLDAKYRMTFNIKDSAVQSIFAGVLPQVQYVEGRS